MDTVLFLAFAAAYVALLARGLAAAGEHGWWTAANLPLLILAGLVYDNLVLAAGRFIGEGLLLEGLNLARYWIHALLTPLLVVFAWHATRRAGVGAARTRAAAVAAVVFAASLVVLELVTVVAGLSLRPERQYGVLSYTSVNAGVGPPLMVLFVTAALLVAAFVVWRRQGWVWFLAGTVLMVIGSGVPVPVESGAVTNAFELILLSSILVTKQFQDHAEDRLRHDGAGRPLRATSD